MKPTVLLSNRQAQILADAYNKWQATATLPTLSTELFRAQMREADHEYFSATARVAQAVAQTLTKQPAWSEPLWKHPVLIWRAIRGLVAFAP